MTSAIMIVMAVVVAALGVIVLLVASKGARRLRSDTSAGADGAVVIMPATMDFGTTSAIDGETCDTGGWSDGGDASGGDCGGGDGGGGGD